MNALQDVPAKFRSVPSIERLGTALEKARTQNRRLRTESGSKVDLIESTAASAAGAAMCGIAMSRGWTEGALGVAGGGLVVVGLFTGQSALIHMANGFMAPMIAGAALKWAAGLQSQPQGG